MTQRTKQRVDVILPAQAASLYSKHKFTWFCAGVASGKCLGKGTKVLMHNGSTKSVEEIAVGERIMGWDGNPRNILSTTSGKDTMYKVIPNKGGDAFVCNSVHILTLQCSVTKEIMDVPLDEYLANRHRRKYRDCKLISRGVDSWEERETVIDPYLMGLWLGDGSRRDGDITTIDSEIVEYIKNTGYDVTDYVTKDRAPRYYIKGSVYRQHVRSCVSASGEKFIDNQYLINSRESRLSLLAGIIDTDGYFANKSYYEVVTKYDQLKDDILFLARSLGFMATVRKKVSGIKSTGFKGEYWRINICGDIAQIPVLLDRKRALSSKRKADHNRTGFKVEEIGHGDYYGFEIDGDGRFLLGDFTVTHNTRIGSRFVYLKMIRNPETMGLICANTYSQLNTATLPPLMEYLEELGIDYVKNKKPPKSWGIRERVADYTGVLTTKNGCHILLRSLDNFLPLRGIEIGWAWIDEISDTSPDAWDIIIARLRCKRSIFLNILVTGTPEGNNWTWQEFSREDATEHKIIYMSARDNPFLPEGFIDSLASRYSKLQAQEQIDGRVVVNQTGKIYHAFHDFTHIKDVYPYDITRPLCLSWDFNIGERPMSMAISQVNYNKETKLEDVQVLDEVVIPNGNTPLVCAQFIKKYRHHVGGLQIFGDSYGSSRAATAGKSDYEIIAECMRAVFANVFFQIPNGNPKEVDRVNAVNAKLQNSMGQVSLYVSPQCKELVLDFKNVKPNALGAIDKKDLKRTHISDGIGYLISQRWPIQKRMHRDLAANLMVR